MELKRYDHFKKFIARAMGTVLVAFLCISGFGFRNVEKYKIHADTYTPVQKQSFVTWLLSYFGINIYTDAQQISDDLYTVVKNAYDIYLATLQPQQQVTFDDILNGVTWDNAQPNTLKLTGYIFNALKGFADYLDSKVTTASEALQIGEFEIVEETASAVLPNDGVVYNCVSIPSNSAYVNIKNSSNTEIKVIFLTTNNTLIVPCYVSLSPAGVYYSNFNGNPNVNPSNYGTLTSNSYNGNTYYYYQTSAFNVNNLVYTLYEDLQPILVNYTTAQELRDLAYRYTYGDLSGSGEITLNDVYALPQQGILDDLIGAADPESDVELDLDGSNIAYSTALTLADIIGMINDAVNVYVLDDSYPDTAAKIAAQSQVIENELTDVDYPNASSWEVPQTISTPQIIPLIQPDCPDLSACLVAGIQDVGSSLGSVIDANSNVSNYVSVILFMGIALTILGGI